MSPTAAEILAVLKKRDGIETQVRLKTGRVYRVFNIAWGQDDSDPELHVTTNISPDIEGASVDLFFTNEVSALLDPTSNETLFSRPSA